MLVKQGDTGPAVDLVQSRLRDLGYLPETEAGFGPATARAVRRLQEAPGPDSRRGGGKAYLEPALFPATLHPGIPGRRLVWRTKGL
jgi:peptidoglycan hydrolase-like protein with peptidoglycan-binding domain